MLKSLPSSAKAEIGATTAELITVIAPPLGPARGNVFDIGIFTAADPEPACRFSLVSDMIMGRQILARPANFAQCYFAVAAFAAVVIGVIVFVAKTGPSTFRARGVTHHPP